MTYERQVDGLISVAFATVDVHLYKRALNLTLDPDVCSGDIILLRFGVDCNVLLSHAQVQALHEITGEYLAATTDKEVLVHG